MRGHPTSPTRLPRQPHSARRLGGDPDLPAGAAYPTAADGVPLYFISQFDLADLQGTVAGRISRGGLMPIFRPQSSWGSCYPTPADCPRLVWYTPQGTPLAAAAAHCAAQ